MTDPLIGREDHLDDLDYQIRGGVSISYQPISVANVVTFG